MKKPWRIMTNNFRLWESLNKIRCPGVSELHKHEPCAGRNTKASGDYTDELAKTIVRAYLDNESTACVAKELAGDEDWTGLVKALVAGEHRNKGGWDQWALV